METHALRLFRELAEITAKTNNLWSVETEDYLLEHDEDIVIT